MRNVLYSNGDTSSQTKQRLKCTGVEVYSGLPYDQLWRDGNARVKPVEQLGDPQQPAGLVCPVEETVD